MRKMSVVAFVVVVLLGMAGIAGAVPVGDGTWQEYYDGGGPGQHNNSLFAVSNSIGEWSLGGMLLDQITSSPPSGVGVYVTKYIDGSLLWNGFDYSGLEAIVTVTIDNLGHYVGNGGITLTGDNGLVMTGFLSESTDPNLPPNPNPSYPTIGHQGLIFDIHAVSTVPEPATLLLLGGGLLGLLAARRRV